MPVQASWNAAAAFSMAPGTPASTGPISTIGISLGSIAVVGNSPTGGMWEDITIWGSKAVVYIRQGELSYKTQHSNEIYKVENLPGSTSPDRNFFDAILGRDEVQVPPVCGLRVIELTEAAWASAESGRPVKVKRREGSRS